MIEKGPLVYWYFGLICWRFLIGKSGNIVKKRLFRESGCFGSKYNIALSLFPDWDNQLTLIGNLMKTQPFVKESKYKFYGCIINEEGLGFCNQEQDLFIIRGKLHICQFSPRARLLAARKGDTLPLPHLMPNANILFFFTSCCQQLDEGTGNWWWQKSDWSGIPAVWI